MYAPSSLQPIFNQFSHGSLVLPSNFSNKQRPDVVIEPIEINDAALHHGYISERDLFVKQFSVQGITVILPDVCFLDLPLPILWAVRLRVWARLMP